MCGWRRNWRGDEKLIGSSLRVNCWMEVQNKRWEVIFTNHSPSWPEKEDAHLSWCLGPYHLCNGCKVFTVPTDSWKGNGRKALCYCCVCASLTTISLPLKGCKNSCFLFACQRNGAVCIRGNTGRANVEWAGLLTRVLSVNLHLRSSERVHLLFYRPDLLHTHIITPIHTFQLLLSLLLLAQHSCGW